MLGKVSKLVYYAWKDQHTGILSQEKSANWYIMPRNISKLGISMYTRKDQQTVVFCLERLANLCFEKYLEN